MATEAEEQMGGDTQQITFQEMRSQIEEKIDDLIFR